MTDRFRKAQRRRRLVRRTILFILAVFVWRFFGPGNALIDTSSLSPLLEKGDVVFVRPVRSLPSRYTVLFVSPLLQEKSIFQELDHVIDTIRNPNGSEPLQPFRVPRIVIAREGDQVTWNDRTVTVRSGERVETHRLAPLHQDLTFPVRQTRLLDGELFLVSVQPGRIDSRFTGPVPMRGRTFRVARIIWPMGRNKRLTPDEVRNSF